MKIAQIAAFINTATDYVKSHPVETPLKKALNEMIPKMTEIFNKYKEKIEDLRIEHSATDDKGIVQRGNQNEIQFTKAGLQAFRNAQLLLLHEEREVTSMTVEVPVEYLSEEEVGAFKGFVLDKKG